MRWQTLAMAFGVFACAAMATPAASAAAIPEYHLVLQNHKFEPATLKVPANTKFKVLVTNRNPTPSEFESSDFNREKIVLPNSTITVFIGPLEKGTYKFFDDFDHATTGVLIVE
ncbi:MAG TPA: cupredoxin domain-containing protein [Rhodanobacteraceae bacterium]